MTNTKNGGLYENINCVLLACHPSCSDALAIQSVQVLVLLQILQSIPCGCELNCAIIREGATVGDSRWGHQVNIDGTSSEWQVTFETDTAMPHTTYWFHAGARRRVFDSTTATLIGSGIIYQTWFNSDSALTIAEGTAVRSSGRRIRITQ